MYGVWVIGPIQAFIGTSQRASTRWIGVVEKVSTWKAWNEAFHLDRCGSYLTASCALVYQTSDEGGCDQTVIRSPRYGNNRVELRLFGRDVDSVFALNGHDENSATYAFGWALACSTTLTTLFAKDVAGVVLNTEATGIELQKDGEDAGYTDIEIICPSVCHLIVEAKRGWGVPTVRQLKKYIGRFNGRSDGLSVLITLSAASREFASQHLPEAVKGFPLHHRSWQDVRDLVQRSCAQATSFRERLWLTELNKHLAEYVSMQSQRDNMVYVVSLSDKPIKEGDPYTWIDVVEQDGCYFHPVGGGWPVYPPNYVGFRHHGRLQSIHHVDQYELVEKLEVKSERWPITNKAHFLYKLGPPMRPSTVMKGGHIWPSGRYWCAIDTLLSGAYATISEARDETSRRVGISVGEDGSSKSAR